jgi:Rod binding domain-containing protein
MSNGLLSTNYANKLVDFAKQNYAMGNIDNFSHKLDLSKSKANSKEEFQKFESLVLSQLIGLMNNTVEVDPVFGGGFAEETMRSMLTDQFGDILAKSGGIGIAKQLQESLDIKNGVSSNASKRIYASKAYGLTYNFN